MAACGSGASWRGAGWRDASWSEQVGHGVLRRDAGSVCGPHLPRLPRDRTVQSLVLVAAQPNVVLDEVEQHLCDAIYHVMHYVMHNVMYHLMHDVLYRAARLELRE